MQLALDLMGQNGVRPALSSRLFGIPKAVVMARQAFKEREVVRPWQLCKSLLHNCPLRPRLSKRSHIH